MKECNCPRCNGDGPPDDEYDDEPVPETIYRFQRPRLISGVLHVERGVVEVNPETHEVIEYCRRVCNQAHYYRDAYEIRKWALRHPIAGPKYVAALNALDPRLAGITFAGVDMMPTEAAQ